MKRLLTGFSLVAIGLFLLSASPKKEVKATQTEINWVTIEEAVKLNQKEPRKWVVDCYTSWCGWCKRMDKETFTDPLIVKEINKNFYAIKFDAESKKDITIGSKTYKFVPQGSRGHHELAALLMGGKMTYPTSVFMDENMKVIQPLAGYLSKEQMLPILMFFSSNTYKSTEWNDYLKEFDSPYSELK